MCSRRASRRAPQTSKTTTITERIRKRVVARGYVQGVFFRDTTRRQAKVAGVAGWVTNRPDGAVEAVFEGEPRVVEEMVEFTRGGPGRAVVESLDVNEEEPEGLDSFEIR
jgi:acylphosphatase